MQRTSAVLFLLCLVFAVYTPTSSSMEPPAFLNLVPDLDPAQFAEPPALFWPGYFWLWNDPLDENLLIEQLRDMAGHGARSVCMLPMPHGFRPQSTNNRMDPDYLTPEYFERVRVAAEEADRLNMCWWLYDEGGWPSGSALGKVVEGHPELQVQRLEQHEIPPITGTYQVPAAAFVLLVEPGHKVFKPGDSWKPAEGEHGLLYSVAQAGAPDLLNPATTQRFISLTHEGYKPVLGSQFGKGVLFAFTDEPAVPVLEPGIRIPWTPGMETLWEQVYGEPIYSALPALLAQPGTEMSPGDQIQRIRFYDLWTARFRDSYFGGLRDWCRNNGIASAGHLGGEDETINAVVHGFGHVMRELRYLDVPGVDLIWRQLFPGREGQHHFPLFAASVAHQNGTRYAFTESFAVYGNGLTPEQMRWLTDYQYVRGLNLLVIGCYPLSTTDHHIVGERPSFGKINPVWDHLKGFHAYVARLGYVLSIGQPKVTAAVYYPVRDMWASGPEAGKKAALSHDRLVAELFARQCGADIIDDDLLSDPATVIENGELHAGAMRYRSILVGDVCWMAPESLAKLEAFADAGGQVLCEGHVPGTDGTPGEKISDTLVIGTADRLAEQVSSLITLTPACPSIRALVRTCSQGEVVFLFNEGNATYQGTFLNTREYALRMDPMTGRTSQAGMDGNAVTLHLLPGEPVLFFLTDDGQLEKTVAVSSRYNVNDETEASEDTLSLDTLLTAFPQKHYVIGDQDIEIRPMSQMEKPFAQAQVWKDWLGEDFSGEVDYVAEVTLPPGWDQTLLRLHTGPVEYAATVLVDDKVVGSLLWAPWQLDLPPLAAGPHRIVIRVANTLANELTSQRVVDLWAHKTGDGWASPYHARALEFEKESRGGGLQGPVVLERLRTVP